MAMDLGAALAVESGSQFKSDTVCYLSVTSRTIKDGDPQLALSGSSHVIVNILRTKESRGVSFYLEGTAPAYILKKTESLMTIRMLQVKDAGSASSSPAYTTKLHMGKYKGRTPAEVLLQEGDAAMAELNNIYGMLSRNSDPKFADANRSQMAAIQDAANLWKSGELVQNGNAAASSGIITIWSGTRTPNVNKVDARGLTETRSMTITYDANPSNDEPYKIEIMNCMAPPVQGAKVGARISQAQDKISLSMSFSEEVWYGLWKDTVDAKGAFSRTIESKQIKNANANTWRPTQSAQQQAQAVQPQPSMQQTGYNNYYPKAYAG